MAEEKTKKNDCCGGNVIYHGFKFGFGFFLAFLTGFVIVNLIAIGFYYLLIAFGVKF